MVKPKPFSEKYSRARLIRMANARKNHANYLSMRIIRAYFMLRSYEWQRVVPRASIQIKRDPRHNLDEMLSVELLIFLRKSAAAF